MLGLVDDVIVIPAGVWLFAKMVPAELIAEHRAQAAQAAERPSSVAGIFLIIALWIVAALIVLSILQWHYA